MKFTLTGITNILVMGTFAQLQGVPTLQYPFGSSQAEMRESERVEFKGTRYLSNNNLNKGQILPDPAIVNSLALPNAATLYQLTGNISTADISIAQMMRSGYWATDPRWVDNDFQYPYYQFAWNPSNTIPSPFYFYSNLPAYILLYRAFIDTHGSAGASGENLTFKPTQTYNWNFQDQYSTSSPTYGVDMAIKDIYLAFQPEKRPRLLNYVISSAQRYYANYPKTFPASTFHNLRTRIVLENGMQYQVLNDDFYYLLRDSVNATKTISYKILAAQIGEASFIGKQPTAQAPPATPAPTNNVNPFANIIQAFAGIAKALSAQKEVPVAPVAPLPPTQPSTPMAAGRILAEHTYNDAWGRVQKMYHLITLVTSPRVEYVVGEFTATRQLPR